MAMAGVLVLVAYRGTQSQSRFVWSEGWQLLGAQSAVMTRGEAAG